MRRLAVPFLSAVLALAMSACRPDRAFGPEARAPLFQIMGDLPTNSLFNDLTDLQLEVRRDRVAMVLNVRIAATLIEARKGSFRLRASARMTEDGGEVGFLEQETDVQTAVGSGDPVDGLVAAAVRLPIPAALWNKLQSAIGKSDPLDLLELQVSLFARPTNGRAFEVARATAVEQDGTVFVDLGGITLNAPAVTLVVDRPMHVEINSGGPSVTVETHVASDLLVEPNGTIGLRIGVGFLEDGTPCQLQDLTINVRDATVVGAPAVPPAPGFTAVSVSVPIDKATWDLLLSLAGPDDPVDEIRVGVTVILRLSNGRYEVGRVNAVDKDGTI